MIVASPVEGTGNAQAHVGHSGAKKYHGDRVLSIKKPPVTAVFICLT
jgi:hypothetical protein